MGCQAFLGGGAAPCRAESPAERHDVIGVAVRVRRSLEGPDAVAVPVVDMHAQLHRGREGHESARYGGGGVAEGGLRG